MADRTTAYARLVVSGQRLAGKTEIACCQRHLDDMERGREFDYIFDAEEAERHITLANMLTIAEGTETLPLHTRGFQNFIIGSLFGWRKKRSKERRYREGYIQVARQNGKSFLSGCFCNDFATFAGYREGRVLCTATKLDQAKIVWQEVAKFIRSDKDLKSLYKIQEHENKITSLVTGTVIKAIGRDTTTADGFRSILAVVDEYHAHSSNQMYKLMLNGQIRVDSALTLAITTAGFNLNGPCYEQYQFSKKVLSGAIEKDSLFIYITELDAEDDLWNPRNWAKANPLNCWLNDTELDKAMLARIAEQAIEAREKGGADLVNFQTKVLNTWVTYSGGALLDAKAWATCGRDVTLADIQGGKECYLGIDLSSGGDLTTISLVIPLEDEKVYLWSHSYMPELRLAEHQRTDEAPYGEWAKAGLLTLTSGMYGIKTDYKAIISELADLIQNYKLKIVGCGYDSHNAAAFLADLEQVLDCDLTEVKQSARSLSDATKDFALSVEAGQVIYDRANKLLTWSAINAILSAPNSFGEIKIDKMTQTDRIDPIDAVLDAWKIWQIEKGSTGVDGEAALDAWLGITTEGKEEKENADF